MKTVKIALKTLLASVSVLVLVSLLTPLSSMAQIGVAPKVPLSTVTDIPNVVNPNENEFQRESHFLTFIGSYIPETADSARAYYKAVDPYNTKPTFADWLKNAGFISDKSQWHAYGPQIIKTGQPTGPGAYGDNIINADSHVIVLNAADLGFVRNQFMRGAKSDYLHLSGELPRRSLCRDLRVSSRVRLPQSIRSHGGNQLCH